MMFRSYAVYSPLRRVMVECDFPTRITMMVRKLTPPDIETAANVDMSIEEACVLIRTLEDAVNHAMSRGG
jgi:hypothetical protein